MHNKKQKLEQILSEMGSVVIAFSSGVDSTFLLKVAHDVLGNKAVALTARSCLVPAREIDDAAGFCEKEGIKSIVLDYDPLSVEGFAANPKDHCYICKKALFTKVVAQANELGITTVVEGSNEDDKGDYRPGMRAIKELGIRSPLQEAGLTKKEIRELSKELGLPTWDKPSFACLASRIPYGDEITEEKLTMVDNAEQILLNEGFRQFRVRVHGADARIELLTDEFGKIMEDDMREEVYKELKKIGFRYISLDLQGYRTGSMNETLL
ncbi:MAG: ATP-dependent sacrificial sulfur transferase LarE [Clostridiales bacterium]|nr:ATP-dependent sacrificial sulfur transferase LarE [Clostridiales bacterium]